MLSVAKHSCWNLHSPPHYCHAVIFTTNNFREKNNNWPEHGSSCSLQGGRGEGDHQDREDRGSQSHSGSRYSPWANTAHYLIMFGQDWMTVWTRDRSARAWWARQPPGEPPGSLWRWWRKVSPAPSPGLNLLTHWPYFILKILLQSFIMIQFLPFCWSFIIKRARVPKVDMTLMAENLE